MIFGKNRAFLYPTKVLADTNKFVIFKVGLKQALVDRYFVFDIAAKIKEKEARREHLTIEELNR